MSETPKHQTITKTSQVGEETITIPAYILLHTLSYTEALSAETETADKKTLTSHVSWIADLLSLASEAWKQSTGNEVTLTIHGDRYHTPRMIRAKYLKSHKDYDTKRR